MKMKKIYCFVFCLSFICSFIQLHASETYRLLIFGDSLSAGYGVGEKNSFASLLQQELYQKGYKNIKVVNKSKSGETTVGGLKRFPKILEQVKPNGVILELGINDVFQGKAVSSIEMNLEQMIKISQQKKIPVLLVGMKAPPYTGLFYQKSFDKMYQKLATKYHLIFYPFFMKGLIEIENGMPVSKYTLQDKIHPNTDGINLMVKNIMPFVEKFLSRIK